MSKDGWTVELLRFFKTARHLWGRCPHCNEPFRLSDIAISTTEREPADWLRKLERERASLDQRRYELEDQEQELSDRAENLEDQERDMRQREKNLERDARSRANDMLKSDVVLNARIKDARKAAIMQSRSVLLGKMLECIAPCFRRFGHDPRDMRAMFDPVDYVLFDGLTVDRSVQEVAFIEVKCGTSRLSPAQRSIRDAVGKRRVRWETWEIGDPRIPIFRQLKAAARQRTLPPAN